MSDLQNQKLMIETTLADSAIYESERKDELKQLLEKQVICKQSLDATEAEWLILQEDLEKIQSS
jgi:ATP-binding cassette subfamily F protein 3